MMYCGNEFALKRPRLQGPRTQSASALQKKKKKKGLHKNFSDDLQKKKKKKKKKRSSQQWDARKICSEFKIYLSANYIKKVCSSTFNNVG